MAATLNRKGVRFARARIRAGDIDQSSPWSFGSRDADRLLGDPPNFDRFSRYFLGVDSSAPPDTRGHYKFPFGKLRGGRFVVFRSGIRAAITRAAQQGYRDIQRAAQSLLQDFPEEQRSQREQRVHERVMLDGDRKIDLEARTITGAALLSERSANGYTYSREALQRAAQLLDGAKVFVNHREQDGGALKPHDVRDYVGRVRETFLDGAYVRAKRFEVLNPQHAQLLEVAQADPNAFGFSIDALVVMDRDGARVVDVKHVHSVDIVAEPATVAGVFEGRTGDAAMETTALESVTVEQLEAQRPDLIDELTAELREQLEKAKEQIGQLEAQVRKHAIDAALVEAGISADDLDDETRTALESCPTEHVTRIVSFFAQRAAPKPRSRQPSDAGGDPAALESALIEACAS